MGLMDKILSSRQAVTALAIQPYKPFTDQTVFGNRSMSPVLNAPPVIDYAFTAAAAGSRVRGNNPVAVTPMPQVLRNGAAAARGNNAPSRGY